MPSKQPTVTVSSGGSRKTLTILADMVRDIATYEFPLQTAALAVVPGNETCIRVLIGCVVINLRMDLGAAKIAINSVLHSNSRRIKIAPDIETRLGETKFYSAKMSKGALKNVLRKYLNKVLDSSTECMQSFEPERIDEDQDVNIPMRDWHVVRGLDAVAQRCGGKLTVESDEINKSFLFVAGGELRLTYDFTSHELTIEGPFAMLDALQFVALRGMKLYNGGINNESSDRIGSTN